jgi:hypothetical protein
VKKLSIREPAVAGAFYPAQPESLKQMIENSFTHERGPGRLPGKKSKHRKITAVVCPHAGYQFSGPCASHSYLELAEQKSPDTVIILGPNHTGWGTPVSIYGEGAWRTPLGLVDVDEQLAREIFTESNIIDYDVTAHRREHSIEVQLPFLQFIYDEFKIVPICMGYQDLKTSIEIGEAVYRAIKDLNAIILASSDLTHQESQESANLKDHLVIDAIEAMDEERLHKIVKENRVTTCGYGPVTSAIVASKKLHALKAKLLTYYTSGDIIGDYRNVVGYAAAKMTK